LNNYLKIVIAAAVLAGSVVPMVAVAHSLRERGEAVSVADSSLSVTPPRDWNRLSGNLGKNTESWSLDGAQLNSVTFYGGIAAGKPLVRERDRKDSPLPKVGRNMLLVEVPELFEGTYRTDRQIGDFQVTSSTPGQFLGEDGIHFSYQYVDQDQLTRKGEARATIIHGKLYMITFDAPRLHYFEQTADDFQALADSARLSYAARH